jgi:hypothetical protein
MRPPEHYVRLLNAMDPLLTLRWGPYVGQWVIERKGIFGPEERSYLKRRRERLAAKVNAGGATKDDVDTLNGVCEEHDSAMNGKRVVIMVRELDRKTYEALCLGDLQRYGGYSRYADEIEKQEAEEEDRKWKKISDQHLDMNKECFGRFGIHDFIVRKKSTELRNGERSIKKLLGLTRDPLEGLS